MDEGVYVPTPADGGVVGAGQSFTILDFVQTNSLGVGTILSFQPPETYR